MIDYEYTDKGISFWGGMAGSGVDGIDRISQHFARAGLPEKVINRCYESKSIVEGFIAASFWMQNVWQIAAPSVMMISYARYSVVKAAWPFKTPSAVSSNARAWRTTKRSCTGTIADGSRWWISKSIQSILSVPC
jgi:hypothetical protein